MCGGEHCCQRDHNAGYVYADVEPFHESHAFLSCGILRSHERPSQRGGSGVWLTQWRRRLHASKPTCALVSDKTHTREEGHGDISDRTWRSKRTENERRHIVDLKWFVDNGNRSKPQGISRRLGSTESCHQNNRRHR